MDKEFNKSKWQSLVNTWNIAKPPATPSCGDISIYQSLILKAMNNITVDRALLLGCTPSLRLLMAQMDIAVTYIDINQNMMISMKKTLSDTIISRESYVCQDWLKMSLPESYFPLIVGDKVFDNVPYKDWSIFKNKLLTHLMSGGYLITRVAPQDPSLINCTFSSLLEKWATRYEHEHLSSQEAASGLWEQALGASVDITPGNQSIGHFSKEINSLNEISYQLNEASRIVFYEFQRLYGDSINHNWTSYTLGNIIDILGEEFSLVSIGHAEDYKVAYRQPVLSFKKLCGI